MSDRPSLQDLLEVQRHFRLPSPALVEKDWHVVQALAAIQSADAGRCRLVFGGGTALSRAHRLTQRMSEDIDLKIVAEHAPSRAELRKLRGNITRALQGAGFVFDPANPEHRDSANESRYTIYRLPYEPVVRGEGALRPEIKIETALWPLRCSSINLDVISFCSEALRRSPEVLSMPCADLTETVAEKFVALTRRAGAELADAGGPRDKTLVRHVYDLHVVLNKCDAPEVIALVRDIMRDDVKAYGHQFPAYRDNPVAETLNAIEGLAKDERFSRAYKEFVRDMVYGKAPVFRTALRTISVLADALRS